MEMQELMKAATDKLKFEMNDTKAWYELIARIGKLVNCLPDITPGGNSHIEEKIVKMAAENLELKTRISTASLGLDTIKEMMEATTKEVRKVIADRDILVGKLIMARQLLTEVVDMAPFSMSKKEAELIQKIRDGLAVTRIDGLEKQVNDTREKLEKSERDLKFEREQRNIERDIASERSPYGKDTCG